MKLYVRSVLTMIFVCIVREVRGYFFVTGSNFSMFLGDKYNNSYAESFFIPFDILTINDENCTVNTIEQPKGEYDIMLFEDNRMDLETKTKKHKFTNLIRTNISAPIIKDGTDIFWPQTANSNGTVYSYYLSKISARCVFETSVVGFTIPNNPQKINTTITQRPICMAPAAFYPQPDFYHNSFSLENTIQFYMTPERQGYYDLYFMELSNVNQNPTVRVIFRSGVMANVGSTNNSVWNDTNPPFIGTTMQPDISATNCQTLLVIEETKRPGLIEDIKMIPLSTINSVEKQFLIYIKNSSKIWVVTTYTGGAQQSSNLTFFAETLPIVISNIMYIQNEFLFIEQEHVVRDAKLINVTTTMNHYVRVPLGLKVAPGLIKSAKKLTMGKYQCSYMNLDGSLMLFDFQIPDLDGTPGETPISTFFFSKFTEDFELYLEEVTQHQRNSTYIESTYKRFITKTYVVEFFNYADNVKDNRTYMSLTNRRTNRALGLIMLPNPNKVYQIEQFPTEFTFFIKYTTDPKNVTDYSGPSYNMTDATRSNGHLLSFGLPNIIFEVIKPNTTNNENNQKKVSARRRLQMNISSNPPFRVTLQVNCSTKENEKPVEKFRTSIYLINPNSEYFEHLKQKDLNDNNSGLEKFNLSTNDLRIDGYFPSGIEVHLKMEKFLLGSFVYFSFNKAEPLKFTLNNNLRNEFFDMTLPMTNMSMPIFFESKKSRLITRNIIFDFATKTSYYRYNDGNFEFFKDAVDNRKISNIEIIGAEDALLNVSRNVFSLNVETLMEKPLTGIGSFCKKVVFCRINLMPEFTLCLTDTTIQAHYTFERFSAKQIKLNLIDISNGLSETLKSQKIVNMMYTNYFPSHLYLLTLDTTHLTYGITVFELYPGMDLYIHKEQHVPLELLNQRLNNFKDEFSHIECLEDYIIVVTKKNYFFSYNIRSSRTNNVKLTINMQRVSSLDEHFSAIKYKGKDYQIEPIIQKFEYVKLFSEPTVDNSYQAEKIYTERLVFMLNLRRLKEGQEIQDPYNFTSIIMFDHRKSSYEAFIPIVRGDDCLRIFMGPAILLEGEKQERSLVVVCITGNVTSGIQLKDTDTPAAKIGVLETLRNGIMSSDNYNLENFFKDFPDPESGKTARLSQINPLFYKGNHILEIMNNTKNISDSSLKSVIFNRTVSMNFSETYALFSTQEKSLKTEKVAHHNPTFNDIIGRGPRTVILREISDYYTGHIFETKVECESMIECRDLAINGTVQLIDSRIVAEYPEYHLIDKYRVGYIKVPKSYNENYEMSYFHTKNNFSFTHEKKKSTIQFPGLGESCTEFQMFELYMIGLCMNSGSQNYFRLFNLQEDMSYFDIKVELPSNRHIPIREISLSIEDNYMSLYSYNSFFKRYLTVYMFKLIQHPDAYKYVSSTNTKVLRNPLINNFSIVHLKENPMNDESVAFRVFKITDDSEKEKLYLWSLRRNEQNSLTVKIEGYLVTKQSNGGVNISLTLEKVCDAKSLNIKFRLERQIGAEYLLDSGMILSLKSLNENYYDVILHLPYAQDYLLRFNKTILEDNRYGKKFEIGPREASETTSEFKDNLVSILSISNPFFGSKFSSNFRPVLFEDMYFTGSNYYNPKMQSIIRCYYIGEEIRKKAKKSSGNHLFNFTDKNLNDGKNNVEESELETAYTFGLIRNPKLIILMRAQDHRANLQSSDLLNETKKGPVKLYIFFNNGSLVEAKVSRHLKLEINVEYLASQYIELKSQGPRALRRVKISITSNEYNWISVIVFMIHIVIIFILAFTCLRILMVWSQKRSNEDNSTLYNDNHRPEYESLESEPVRKTSAAYSGKSPSKVVEMNQFPKIDELGEEGSDSEKDQQEKVRKLSEIKPKNVSSNEEIEDIEDSTNNLQEPINTTEGDGKDLERKNTFFKNYTDDATN